MNETLISIWLYTYLCGGYVIINLLNPPNKKLIFFLWPLIPLYSLLCLLMSTQKEIDDVIEDNDG